MLNYIKALVLILPVVLSGEVGFANEIADSNDVSTTAISAPDLTEGMMGIPFNADVDQVLKWCSEHNVRITNPNRTAIAKFIRGQVQSSGKFKKELKNDAELLNAVEKDNLKQVPTSDLEKQNKWEIENAIKVTKNPNFIYNNQRYYLNQVIDSVAASEDQAEVKLRDDSLTKNNYSLSTELTEKTNYSDANSIDSFKVLFFKNEKGVLRSYAAVAEYNASGNLYEKIMDLLSRKYDGYEIPFAYGGGIQGEFSYAPLYSNGYSFSANSLFKNNQKVIFNDNYPNEIKNLTGIQIYRGHESEGGYHEIYYHYEIVKEWRRDILMLSSGRGFILIYFNRTNTDKLKDIISKNLIIAKKVYEQKMKKDENIY